MSLHLLMCSLMLGDVWGRRTPGGDHNDESYMIIYFFFLLFCDQIYSSTTNFVFGNFSLHKVRPEIINQKVRAIVQLRVFWIILYFYKVILKNILLALFFFNFFARIQLFTIEKCQTKCTRPLSVKQHSETIINNYFVFKGTEIKFWGSKNHKLTLIYSHVISLIVLLCQILSWCTCLVWFCQYLFCHN